MSELTRAEKVAQKRKILYEEMTNKLQECLNKGAELKLEAPFVYALEETDKYITNLINKNPQDKSFIMSVAFELKRNLEAYAKYITEKKDIQSETN